MLYGYVAYGHLLGGRLPVERTDVAAGLGVALFLLGLELLARVPLVGDLVQIGLAVAGFGAVLITYLGLREFEPVEIHG